MAENDPRPLRDKGSVLIDWSGTIKDDRAVVYEANMKLLEKHGITRIAEEAWRMSGALFNASSYLARVFGLSLEDLYDEYSVISRRTGMRHGIVSLFPGVKEFFGRLADQDKSVEIISSHPQHDLENEVAMYGLADFIDRTRGSVTDKALAIRDSCNDSGITPRHALYVGDTIQDVRAARQSGVFAVAVTYGYHNRQDLARVHPDLLVDSLEELATML